MTPTGPGATLGRYTLRRKLGEGTFAEVWRATEQGDLGFRAEVALKILRPARQSEQELAALLKEAALCAELRHPNIVAKEDGRRSRPRPCEAAPRRTKRGSARGWRRWRRGDRSPTRWRWTTPTPGRIGRCPPRRPHRSRCLAPRG